MQAFLRKRHTDKGDEIMIHKRMDEASINTALDACLHGAKEGDFQQARQLHEMLDFMLTEREVPDGKLWLTEHGKMLLADMHRQLSHCEDDSDHLRDTVLEAVQLRPQLGRWKDTCSYVHDLKVAITVANELCEQRNAGRKPDIDAAAQTVAERGEFDLDPRRICEVYDEIAANVGGFREFARC
jgi:hypothetical protein